MFKEFKAFILRGNVLDLAVGVIVGGAFNAIVKSLVGDIIMPPIGLLLGKVDFADLLLVLKVGDPAGPYATLADAQAAGAVTINYGLFVNNVVSFVITALAVFLVIKAVNRLKREKKAPPPPALTDKECPYCFTKIPLKATRCPHCTSQLEA
jgi:large conductance mechanosensitive channel